MLKVKTSKGVWSITTDHSGKMKYMWSTSTSKRDNELCALHSSIKGAICEYCYVEGQLKRFPTQEKPYKLNMELLANNIIPMEEVPVLNCAYFRIEAFGDIANTTQAINYIRLVEKNPHCNFGWFTKNPLILASALRECGYSKKSGKPNNLNVILSSIMINKPCESKFWFVDKVFTVYDKEESKKVNINCGAKQCFSCKLCYTKNDVHTINETLK